MLNHLNKYPPYQLCDRKAEIFFLKVVDFELDDLLGCQFAFPHTPDVFDIFSVDVVDSKADQF